MTNFNRYTKEEFVQAIQSSRSIRQVLQKLNVAPWGGNYATCKKYIKELNLDTSHFCGKGWAKGQKLLYKIVDINEYLMNNKPIQTHALRLRLLKDKILSYKCNNCQNTEWLNKPIPLELHHKNGNSLDNTLSNLELLCPNCHSLTSNHRGKNKK
jgi:hypothetical protein